MAARVSWAIAATLAGAVLAALPPSSVISAAAQEGAQPQLRVIEPTENALLVGPVTLAAEVTPDSTPVRRVDFFVDGVLICQKAVRPFTCDWDAGTEVKARVVRVAVSLNNTETRLIQNVRTASLERTENVSVDSVLVPVVVQDGRGRFINGLTGADFRVFEDDAPQKVTFFQAEEIPLDVAVAVDMSGSMGPILPQVKQAVRRFVSALKPTDRLTLVAFNDRIFALTRQEMNPAARLQAIDRLSAFGRTSLNDAMVTTVGMIGNQISRRALVVFTDGDDTQSLASMDSVERRLRESDASVYVIMQGESGKNEANQQMMRRFTQLTGGRSFAISNIRDLEEVLADIMDDLSHQYLLGYSPTNTTRDGSYRKLRVELVRRRNSVRARDGYWAPGP